MIQKQFWNNFRIEKKFGNKRVFDVPTSENALTGIGVGAAISGIRTVITHQRLDFLYFRWTKSSIVQQNGGICLVGKLMFH